MSPSEQPAAAAMDSAPSADNLQFRKAEMPGDAGARICSVCQQPIRDSWYQVNGAAAHGICTQQFLAVAQRRGGAAEFGRAALCGLGAAIGGSLLFGLVTYLAHITLSILAILVGVMVAKAILYGSRGCRGRRYQVLAVLLTYGSITVSYMPLVMKGFSKAAEKVAQKKAKAQTTAAVPVQTEKITGVQFAIGTIFMLLFTLVMPFFLLTSAWGWVNLLIIGIGLMRAWRGTAPIPAVVAGPFAAAP